VCAVGVAAALVVGGAPSDAEAYDEGFCTEHASRMRPDLPDLGDAYHWGQGAREAGFPVDDRPRRGDIAVFPANNPSLGTSEGGHVAYVEWASGTGFFLSEMNWEGQFNEVTTRVFDATKGKSAIDQGIRFIHRKGYGSEGVAGYAFGFPASGTVPLHRLYKQGSGHLYTLSEAEASAASALGYTYEGVRAYVLKDLAPGRVPLYRLHKPGRSHFYTTDANEADAAAAAGYVREGITGYLLSQPPVIPLYRLLNLRAGSHFYTTSLVERDTLMSREFASEGVTAFVLPTPSHDSVPLYRLYKPGAGHFYTRDGHEAFVAAAVLGYQNEGAIGHVFAWQRPGTSPLFRLYSPSLGHFYTSDAREANAAAAAGYTTEGVAAYVFANPGAVPLYRMFNPETGAHFYTTDLAERDRAMFGY
jgi:hypothetical protein